MDNCKNKHNNKITNDFSGLQQLGFEVTALECRKVKKCDQGKLWDVFNSSQS